MFPTRRITTGGGDVFRDEFSLAFDGTDDFIQLPMPINYSAVTISAWIKVTEDSNTKVIVGARDSSSDGLIFFLDSSERLVLRVNGQGTSTTGMDITPNVWTHVVGTYDGDKAIAYINTIASSPKDISTDGITTVTSNARIGCNAQSSANPYNGNISEIAIYNKSLSASEVKTLYNGREPYNHKEGVCSSNLQAWYRMGDGVLDTQPSNHTNSLLISDNTNATKGSNLWTETYSSNTGSWSEDGTNDLTQENNAIKITGDGSDSDGARIKLRASDDMSSNLTVGKLYELAFQSKVSSGSSVNVQFQISNAHSFVNFVNYTTEYKQFRHYFIATDATEAEIKCSAMGDGETIFMKDFSVREINGNAGVGENFDGSNIVGDTP